MGSSHRSYGVAPPAYALPDGAQIGGVRLQVSDLRRSVGFYEQVLGLRVISSNDVTTLGPHGDTRSVVTLQTRAGVTPARRGTFGLFHFALLLPDRAALGRFTTHLARLKTRFSAADHRVSESLYLWDPDGLGIEVYADRPRQSWRQSGRELVMTTEPLDLGALAIDAGGIPWDGAPPGTRMGHVHLSVGDLDRAEAFYHRALGFDKTVWSYPGALFMAAGGYHHHLGTNTWSSGPSPAPEEAQLLEWEIVVPSAADVIAAGRSLQSAGYAAEPIGSSVTALDPWGTRLQIREREVAPL